MNKRDIEILQFLHDRMIEIHHENPNFDYMINFHRIISEAST
jgi:hypothetical protein